MPRQTRSLLAAAGLATAVLALPVALAPVASAAPTTSIAAPAACETLRQYVSTADSLSVRTQPNSGGDIRGYLPRGGKFNLHGQSADGTWFYGYADGIGFGFVLARYLDFSREITSC